MHFAVSPLVFSTSHPGATVATSLSVAAIVIAGLALIVSWQNHKHTVQRDKRLEQRSVTVLCQGGYTVGGPVLTADGSTTTHLLNVSAVNGGFRPVEIRSIIFNVSDGQSLFAMPIPDIGDKLPERLADGESLTVYYDQRGLDNAAAQTSSTITSVVVTDSHGTSYSTPYPSSLPRLTSNRPDI